MEEKLFGVVEKSWIKNGYHCFVIFTQNGVRNGYIGIPKTNKMYGVYYSQESEFLKIEDCKDKKYNGNIFGLFRNMESGKLSPDLYFSAHGGFTYSDLGLNMPENYGANKELWYFGFDCNHYNDGQDFKKALEYGLVDYEEFECCRYFRDGLVRTVEFCEENLNLIADELAEFEAIKKQVIFTDDEKVILRNLPNEYKWIAREKSGILIVGIEKPERYHDTAWVGRCRDLFFYDHLFQSIQWGADEPVNFREYL